MKIVFLLFIVILKEVAPTPVKSRHPRKAGALTINVGFGHHSHHQDKGHEVHGQQHMHHVQGSYGKSHGHFKEHGHSSYGKSEAHFKEHGFGGHYRHHQGHSKHYDHHHLEKKKPVHEIDSLFKKVEKTTVVKKKIGHTGPVHQHYGHSYGNADYGSSFHGKVHHDHRQSGKGPSSVIKLDEGGIKIISKEREIYEKEQLKHQVDVKGHKIKSHEGIGLIKPGVGLHHHHEFGHGKHGGHSYIGNIKNQVHKIPEVHIHGHMKPVVQTYGHHEGHVIKPEIHHIHHIKPEVQSYGVLVPHVQHHHGGYGKSKHGQLHSQYDHSRLGVELKVREQSPIRHVGTFINHGAQITNQVLGMAGKNRGKSMTANSLGGQVQPVYVRVSEVQPNSLINVVPQQVQHIVTHQVPTHVIHHEQYHNNHRSHHAGYHQKGNSYQGQSQSKGSGGGKSRKGELISQLVAHEVSPEGTLGTLGSIGGQLGSLGGTIGGTIGSVGSVATLGTIGRIAEVLPLGVIG